jgi:hypothetical protein
MRDNLTEYFILFFNLFIFILSIFELQHLANLLSIVTVNQILS